MTPAPSCAVSFMGARVPGWLGAFIDTLLLHEGDIHWSCQVPSQKQKADGINRIFQDQRNEEPLKSALHPVNLVNRVNPVMELGIFEIDL